LSLLLTLLPVASLILAEKGKTSLNDSGLSELYLIVQSPSFFAKVFDK
jgi:hypothetical protein